MKACRYAISWIYGEFRIARMQHGLPLESWRAPYEVHDLAGLSQALAEAAGHLDLTRGGDVAIAYEDDLHTHEFFDVPSMSRKDLEKLLQRKVELHKPFEDEAAWCYHEARHDDSQEGILLHRLPQRIVDAVVRICQQFYLTPRRMVPLTEIVSQSLPRHRLQAEQMVAVVSLFAQRTQIVVTLGNGETLLVREMSYVASDANLERLITELNRTVHYCRQQFGKPIEHVYLLGEQAERVHAPVDERLALPVHLDEQGLDPLYWAIEVARLPDKLSANFIPLLARKKINRALFARVAVLLFPLVVTSSLTLAWMGESIQRQQSQRQQSLQAAIHDMEEKLEHLQSLISRRDQSLKQLSLLQADNQNLPALFISHLGDLVPAGVTLQHAAVTESDDRWQVSLSGTSVMPLQQAAQRFALLQQRLQQPPWNIHIEQGWQQSWYRQLQAGAAAAESTDFSLQGWMR